MSRARRIAAEATGTYRTFIRRRTAVFFTFFFPVLLIVIFAGLVRTQSGSGGLFSEPTGYYVPAYLATVVLFTPLSRVGSTVARHREGNRFEKLATTPLTRAEWLAAHTLVNVALIAAASAVLLVALKLTGAEFALSPWLAFFVPVASVVFCGIGAVLGSVADGQDGAIAMSNGVALPLFPLRDVRPAGAVPGVVPAGRRPLTARVLRPRGPRRDVLGGDVVTNATVLAVLQPSSHSRSVPY